MAWPLRGERAIPPLPGARMRYADFPAMAGEAVHLGPIAGDQTYDCVQNLELVGCNFQNGTVFYESGGPAGRTVGWTNNIFESCLVTLWDMQNAHGNAAETLTAVNNLFYCCSMWLSGVVDGGGNGIDNWTFWNNIFETNSIHGTKHVSVNCNNAYE